MLAEIIEKVPCTRCGKVAAAKDGLPVCPDCAEQLRQTHAQAPDGARKPGLLWRIAGVFLCRTCHRPCFKDLCEPCRVADEADRRLRRQIAEMEQRIAMEQLLDTMNPGRPKPKVPAKRQTGPGYGMLADAPGPGRRY